MPRRFAANSAGIMFHVFNRSVRGTVLFDTPADYDAIERILAAALQRSGLALLAYCLMPNHWHFVARPVDDRQLPDCMHWLCSTHAKRWQTFRRLVGTGAVYQSRYHAIPVQTETYFLTLCRYVERNPLRAGLVKRAEDWPWSSARADGRNDHLVPLRDWPIPRPPDWIELVNQPQTGSELELLRASARQQTPLGTDEWVAEVATSLGLTHGLRGRGRPRKTR